MLDLSEYSNTDLKLAYGVGNFKVLCEYDENFNHFLLALTNLHVPAPKPVFIRRRSRRFCLPSTTAHKNDRLHQSCRRISAFGRTGKISALIRNVKDGPLPHKEALIQALEQKLMAYR